MVFEDNEGYSLDYAHQADKYYTVTIIDAKSFINGSLCYFTKVYWVQL